jgi:hypothetical protein
LDDELVNRALKSPCKDSKTKHLPFILKDNFISLKSNS